MVMQQRDRREFKKMLMRLHSAKPEELSKVKEEVATYFGEIDPKELALAEQELIKEGVGREEMRRLCDLHLEIMKDKLTIKGRSIELAPSHPVSILKDEHEIIKGNLKKLKDTLEELKVATSFGKAKKAIDTLKELSHFFIETEKHYQREEEGIFPRLIAHGVTEPPEIFKEDHVEFKAKKKLLYEIALGSEKRDYKEFVREISPIIEFLVKNLEEHIYKEDYILYPMSLQVIEEAEWKDIRKKFDAIGYCCFTPHH